MVYKLFDSLLDLPAEDLVQPDLSELSYPCLPSFQSVCLLSTPLKPRWGSGHTSSSLQAEAGGLPGNELLCCLAISAELSPHPQHPLLFLPPSL